MSSMNSVSYDCFCAENYTKMRKLPCPHSFHAVCIQKHVDLIFSESHQAEGDFPCMQCRHPFWAKHSGRLLSDFVDTHYKIIYIAARVLFPLSAAITALSVLNEDVYMGSFFAAVCFGSSLILFEIFLHDISSIANAIDRSYPNVRIDVETANGANDLYVLILAFIACSVCKLSWMDEKILSTFSSRYFNAWVIEQSDRDERDELAKRFQQKLVYRALTCENEDERECIKVLFFGVLPKKDTHFLLARYFAKLF